MAFDADPGMFIATNAVLVPYASWGQKKWRDSKEYTAVYIESLVGEPSEGAASLDFRMKPSSDKGAVAEADGKIGDYPPFLLAWPRRRA